jgi:hypothetical protein
MFIDRETDSKFDIVYDGNLEWKFLLPERETEELAAYKRRLVCKHPLEWDKSLYGRNTDEHFKSVIGAIDIWKSIRDKRMPGFSKNAFWFAHPVYFINHWDRCRSILTYPIPVREDLIPLLEGKRPGTRLNFLFITIHSTANLNSYAQQERDYLINPSNTRKASYHIMLDENEAIIVIPLDEVAYSSSTLQYRIHMTY